MVALSAENVRDNVPRVSQADATDATVRIFQTERL
jgi:hypothetical protein